ncbi:MAG: oligosaccharide flippase family protein [Chloroherpetonaceae bacterium]|nr:oligosaccharide flippase family protein [Chthonomonadaceae bacterium]MDW8206688.1 oligosaccharide flippase family protein [Chloroherpetonaceae bacterium]
MQDSRPVTEEQQVDIRPMRLRKNFSWTFLGNTVYAVSQWGMLTLIARLGSREMVGQFALGLAIATPVITFTNMALRQVQATDARRQYQFRDYLALRLTMTLAGFLTILGITWSVGYPVQTAQVVWIIGLAKSFEAISDVFYGLMQFYEQMDRIAISMMLRGLLSLGALGLGLVLTGGLLWGATGLALTWFILLLAYDVPVGWRILLQDRSAAPDAHALRPRWDPVTLRQLLWLTLPLGIATMLNALSVNIPRYLLERRSGPAELGLFAAMSYVLLAGTTVITALGQSASPRLARHFAAGNTGAFLSLLGKLTGLAIAIGCGLIALALLAGRPLLTALYTAEYAHRTDVFLWLTVAATAGYAGSCLGYGLTAARNFAVQPFIYGTAATISLIASALLIPRSGLLGSAWALLVLNLAQVLIAGVLLSATLRRQRMREGVPCAVEPRAVETAP